MLNKMYRSQAGMTMVELMVAMLLAVLLGGGVISVFLANNQSSKQGRNLLHMQDDARHALGQLSFDISMSGHYASLLVPRSVTADALLTLGTDCGPAASPAWMFQTNDAATGESLSITAIDNATEAQAIAAHSCFAAGELQPGTDIVAIKRVQGGSDAALDAGVPYLRTNGTVGLLFSAPFPAAPTIPVAAPAADWQFRPSIYYVRQFATVAADGIPTLCRKVLAGQNMTTECIASGIEDLQIEYGIDTTLDGQPNVFLPNPTLAQIQNVVSARIFILARTETNDTAYTNAKTFAISNAPAFTPNDSFHRRVFSTSVTIQNIRSMNMMGF